MNKEYFPKVGDVIKHNGDLVVVADIKNYEDNGSCSYDRKYLLCDLDYLENNQGIITMTKLEQHGKWLTVDGIEFPYFEKVNVAPFQIGNVECKVVRRKAAKTIEVWE